ncbi:hypothetical protein vseg_020434 [Gypsophila vaccaria]
MGKSVPHEDEYYDEEDSEQYEDEDEDDDDDVDEIEVVEENAEQCEQKAEGKSIVVKVKRIKSGVNDELSMQIDVDVELRWLMIHYCDKVGDDNMNRYNSKFMFNGARVRETDTPLRLSMLHADIIYVFPDTNDYGPLRFRSGDFYRTLSIRMHKRRDTLVRVGCTEPLAWQIKRHLYRENAEKYIWTCFFYNGQKLTEDDCVAGLNMKDGDIIDAFDFDESSSSVKIITPITRHMTLKVKYQHGRVVFFKIMGSTLLTKLVHRCADIISIEPEKLRLIYSGQYLRLDKTVEEENLFDGCPIDVLIRSF